MALYPFMKSTQVIRLPHKKEFDAWRKNISDSDFDKVYKKLYSILENMDDKEHKVSSFVPGNIWIGTIWEPLYHACGKHKKMSGLFFGQIMFLVAMEHDDEFYFYRGDKGDRDYIGMTYFRKKD